jgi:hypothetical protein
MHLSCAPCPQPGKRAGGDGVGYTSWRGERLVNMGEAFPDYTCRSRA